jgi:hypothetical protein
VEDRVQAHGPAGQLSILRPAANAHDASGTAGEQLGGEVAERADDARLDQLDLPEEMRLAGLDLLRSRVAVARRAMLEDVRHEDVAAIEPDLGEQLVEQLPGASHERDPLLVLVEARRLADEHQVGIGVPVPEHQIGGAIRQRAGAALSQAPIERHELLAPLRGVPPGSTLLARRRRLDRDRADAALSHGGQA